MPNILTWLDMLRSSMYIRYLIRSTLFLTDNHLANLIVQAVCIFYMTMKKRGDVLIRKPPTAVTLKGNHPCSSVRVGARDSSSLRLVIYDIRHSFTSKLCNS